jgi:hypothetical protein
MSKYFIVISLSLLFVFPHAGKAQRVKKWVQAAEQAYERGDYYSAFKLYEVILRNDSTRADIQYRYAQSARLFNAWPSARAGYAYVLASPDSAQYPEARYYLGLTLQQMGDYQGAFHAFDRFLKAHESQAPDSLVVMAKARRQAASLAAGSHFIAPDDERIRIRQLDSGAINTIYSEIAPVLRGDTLYYSSYRFPYSKDRHGRQYVRVLKALSGPEGGTDGFLPGALLPVDFELDGKHMANMAFSADGRHAYCSICEYVDLGKVRCDLYLALRAPNGQWSNFQKLDINVPGFTTTHPSVGFDRRGGQRLLYFASDRPHPEARGKLDLYYSVLDPNGLPGSPVNIAALNTVGDDVTPFFHESSQQLYFSSDGHPGWGGLDIFRTTQNDRGDWETPIGMPPDINSSYNDHYFFLNPDGNYALFSSDRLGSAFIAADQEACCHDLYSADLPLEIRLLARTFNNIDQEALAGCTVTLYEVDANGQKIPLQTLTHDDNNEFRFMLERDKRYFVEAVKEGFSADSFELNLTQMTFVGSATIERDLFLEPQIIDLQVMVFDLEDEQPLSGAKVTYMEVVNGVPRLIDEKINPIGNDFIFPVEANRTYLTITELSGYFPRIDTIFLTPEQVREFGPRITVDVYLQKTSFELYFDNDAPDRRSYSPTTRLAYGDTFDDYYNRKEEFISRYTDGLDTDRAATLREQYEDFFERDVRLGYEKLMEFSQNLLPVLRAGYPVTIRVRGFASPRASAQYNLILSKRRISSVRNHFERHENGVFLPFLDKNRSGLLRFVEEALGESTASRLISDSIADEKESIFSVIASGERRVEVRVEIGASSTSDIPLIGAYR